MLPGESGFCSAAVPGTHSGSSAAFPACSIFCWAAARSKHSQPGHFSLLFQSTKPHSTRKGTKLNGLESYTKELLLLPPPPGLVPELMSWGRWIAPA